MIGRFKINKIAGVAILILNLVSCQEPYNISELENTKAIPVFEGALTNEKGPYKVTIFYARPFGGSSASTPTPVAGASVYIKDDFGTSILLKEGIQRNGIYTTPDTVFKGIIGRKYWIFVKFKSGAIYESVPIKLEPAKELDSIYAEPGTYETASTTATGEFIKKTTQGIYVYVDVNINGDETKYFRLNNHLIWQLTRVHAYGTESSYAMYYRKVSVPDNLPNIKTTITVDGKQLIKKHKLFFIAYIPDLSNGFPDSLISPYSNAGWVVASQLSTISKEVYNYFLAVNKQLGAGSQLFDPIATQINGNIVCKSDTTQMALGVFEVYSKSYKNIGFNWTPNKKTVGSRDVADPGPFVNDTNRNKPSYWVNFYGTK